MKRSNLVTDQRLQLLEEHLRTESPFLVDVVGSFRELDEIARRMGLLSSEQSFATQVSWWPLVSILGTFSAGKSSFVNYYLGRPIQRTGNQAVDDRFTVICYGNEERTLPGVALDSDLRFPFYRISNEIDEVAEGEGRRIDSYLQLRTLPSDKLRGRILIDSPGFDADAQRTSTLRISDQIIDLSDLVIVLFDARHPEPGAMRDTLEHLVRKTIHRSDAAKFLYVLNQIDTSARDNNSEEVVAAWQRALSEAGLTAGRFYVVYNPDAANLTEDESRRLSNRIDKDLAEILDRLETVGVARAYRVVSTLEKVTDAIAEQAVPRLLDARARWRRAVLLVDAIAIPLLLVGAWFAAAAAVDGSLWEKLRTDDVFRWGAVAVAAVVAGLVHFTARALAAKVISARLRQRQAAEEGSEKRGSHADAFLRGTAWWRSLLAGPAGCGSRAMARLDGVRARALRHVQKLNESYTNPSGAEADAASGS